jgi:hypothetical protein
LRHNLENLWVDGPVVQVGDGALEQRRHASVPQFNVPVMARIIRVWPRNTDQADEMSDWIFLGMLI